MCYKHIKMADLYLVEQYMIPKIILASSAGFCFGVKRAVNLLEAEIEKYCGDKTNDKLEFDEEAKNENTDN